MASKSLSSLSLQQVLDQALQRNFQETTFSFLGVPVTLRNLTKIEYDEIAEEMLAFSTDHEENVRSSRYITEFCFRNLVRSIMQIGSHNFRGVKHVIGEDSVKEDVATFLRRNFLSKLSQENFNVLWAKFNELVEEAESHAKEGITFKTPSERPEEKAEKLVRDLAELNGEVSSVLMGNLLKKYGVMVSDRIPDTDPAPPPPPPHHHHPSPVIASHPIPDPKQTPKDPPGEETPSDLSDLPPPPPPIHARSLKYQEIETLPITEMEGVSLPVTDFPILEKKAIPQASSVAVDRPPAVGINPRFSPPRR